MRLAWAAAAILYGTVAAVGQQAEHSLIPTKQDGAAYPPIGRAAHVSGDVLVRFAILADGKTTDVAAKRGSPMLTGAAEKIVRSWQYSPAEVRESREITFHFRLAEATYSDEGPQNRLTFDDSGNPTLSSAVASIERTGCPSTSEAAVPEMLTQDDSVELSRSSCYGSCPAYSVKVSADGTVRWDGSFAVAADKVREVKIDPEAAQRLLEAFRRPVFWEACGDYSRSVTDSASYSLQVQMNGLTKKVSEYAETAPGEIHDLEKLVDEVADTHRWRVGDPKQEAMEDIYADLGLPKPGKTKLMVASYQGKREAMDAALTAGDKITDTDASGWTPLMYAALGSGDGVKFLVEKGADVNARGPRGETALMFAALMGESSSELISAGAEVNAVNEDGMTPLMLTAERGEPEAITALLKAGAKAVAKDHEGRTALDYLLAANCGLRIQGARPTAVVGYAQCTALDEDDLRRARAVLERAGASQTRPWMAKPMPVPQQEE